MALCVLNMIMGGGDSFSAGGPGKGMYTRLYGGAGPESSEELTTVMVREAINMLARPPSDKEMNRAKQALASNICFEFENRQIVFEDIARQVQVYGSHKTPEMWREDIMAVNKEDISRVAHKLLQSNPTLLAMGQDVSRVPQQEEIKTAIKDVSRVPQQEEIK